MITRRAKYGLKALMFLAASDRKANVGADEIARANNIPHNYLQGILHDLSKSGIVLSKKGPAGGFKLSSRSDDAAIGEMLRILGGSLSPLACADPNATDCCPDCKSLQGCRVRLAMVQVHKATAGILDDMTLRDMVGLTPD
jgi:Rrf2 family protein